MAKIVGLGTYRKRARPDSDPPAPRTSGFNPLADRSPLPVAPATLRGRPATDACLLDATDDRSAVLAWVYRHRNSAHTHSSYVKEADRFYRWCLVRGTPLSTIAHEDFEAYLAFLANPQPAEIWVSRARSARSNPAWRPLSGPLSGASIRQAAVILESLFAWLVEARYLQANPVSLMTRRARSVTVKPLERYLGADLVVRVFGYIEQLDTESPGQPRDGAHMHRCRWLFALFFLTGIRISELCNLRMRDFVRDARVRKSTWWLHVTGKGSKTRKVPVTDDLLAELRRYRVQQGLIPLPSPTDALPAVLALQPGRRNTPLSRSSAHRIVKTVLAGAADWLDARAQGDDAFWAEHIRHASAHWLRHSYGTALADLDIDLRTIRDNLGHASLQTTSIYLHRDDARRHAETQDLSVRRP